MSEEILTSKSVALSLAAAYRESAYPQYHVVHFNDPLNSAEAYGYRSAFQRAIDAVGIEDYKLFFEHTHIEARFQNVSDHFLFTVALKPSEKVEVDYFYGEMTSTNRSLDRVRKSLRKLVKAMGLDESIRFELDRENKAVAVFANDGNTFLRFDAKCRSIPGKYQALMG